MRTQETDKPLQDRPQKVSHLHGPWDPLKVHPQSIQAINQQWKRHPSHHTSDFNYKYTALWIHLHPDNQRPKTKLSWVTYGSGFMTHSSHGDLEIYWNCPRTVPTNASYNHNSVSTLPPLKALKTQKHINIPTQYHEFMDFSAKTKPLGSTITPWISLLLTYCLAPNQRGRICLLSLQE